ncbi:transcription factor bHLH145-like [Euphorbia lathyris]|uniref:transcription factor bHLH145-like n=1 Tax=Euphorbia lathyris TaxID=212925 RepID=UPI003313D459
MVEDWGSWFPQQQIDMQSSNLNCLGPPLGGGKRCATTSIVNPATDMVSIKATSSIYQPLEPFQWPQFPQAYTPALNYGFKGKFPTVPYDNRNEVVSPKMECGCGQKKFLVFDQSGDETSLIFGSGMRTPVGYFTCLGTNTSDTCNVKTGDPGTKDNMSIHLGAIEGEQWAKVNGADLGSEMQEDTDELNALLYSDDESDYGEDDEVTSTGQSPSTMTFYKKQKWLERSIEGVGGSKGSSKKRKLLEGAVMDRARSVKDRYEDDAESRCENRKSWALDEMVCECKKKKMRIRETVKILQKIIPCGKGKDLVVVIDEAINYLKSLKLKAKALGVNGG